MTKLGSHVSKHHQRGFSLVEIMVALLLGAVITVGIVQMFTSNRTTYQINMGQARLQENARFAMEFVTSSMRMAGYRGCSNRTSITDGLAGDADLLAQFDIDDSIFGHTAVGGGDLGAGTRQSSRRYRHRRDRRGPRCARAPDRTG
ncbi:MAG: prepilin-type N-terminal cleavage/methylation domain-containing protein [Gammaproteobacteria bacterium]|nr:prepilin-type N-terminal cleavage/methylation domain-containing protein [Gammaproteobacteria bacterium]